MDRLNHRLTVSAVMLSSAVSHAESRKIQAHLYAMASGECAPKNEVKLCYVTVCRADLVRCASDIIS